MDRARRTLLIVVGALLAVGMVMVYSASFVVAARRFGSPTYFLQRHAIYLLVGCFALAVTSLCDYHALAKHWRWFCVVAFVLLAAVLVPGLGTKLNGARRWFSIGFLTFQPSEAVKPLMLLGLSGWLVRHQDRIATFKEGFVYSAGLAGAAVFLVALEPDLGSAALLACMLGALLFVAGINLWYAVPTFICALPLAGVAAYTQFSHIRPRLEQWLGASDPLGNGYQIQQALIAQGSGGFFGAGLGQGHAKLLFLPEAHNDFIFAMIGEELGLLGTLSILLLFAVFVIQGWRVARRAPDLLGTLLALGVTLCIGFQAAINFAVVTHSMPTKGISLPFISYGGSSLIFLMASVGILLNVAAHPASDAVLDTRGAVPRKKTFLNLSAAQP
jgi:cell division protein FtsW